MVHSRWNTRLKQRNNQSVRLPEYDPVSWESYCSFHQRAWRHYGECSAVFLILQHDQGGIVLHMLGRVTLVAIGDQVGSSDPLSGCKLIQCSSIQFYLYSICYHCHCLRACSKNPAPDPYTSKSGEKKTFLLTGRNLKWAWAYTGEPSCWLPGKGEGEIVQRGRTDPDSGQPHVAGVCQQLRMTGVLKALISPFMHPSRIQSPPLGHHICLHPPLPPSSTDCPGSDWCSGRKYPRRPSVVSSWACPVTVGSAFREVETKHATVLHYEDLHRSWISLWAQTTASRPQRGDNLGPGWVRRHKGSPKVPGGPVTRLTFVLRSYTLAKMKPSSTVRNPVTIWDGSTAVVTPAQSVRGFVCSMNPFVSTDGK